MEVFATDHSPDKNSGMWISEINELYRFVEAQGLDSLRTDWRWNLIEPKRSECDRVQLSKYTDAARLMNLIGFKPQTVVFSSIPDWAYEVYNDNPEEFFDCYRQFVETVRCYLITLPGEKITRFQILNELNTSIYCRVGMSDISKLCQITRESLFAYNPGVKLVTTVVVGSVISMLARPWLAQLVKPFVQVTSAIQFLYKYRRMLCDNFDVIGVDYYPGMFHRLFSQRFDDLGLLSAVFEKLAGWGIEYELTETGYPTAIWSSEERQKRFYETFFKALMKMLAELRANDIRLPSRIGIYQPQDEDPLNIETLWGKFLKAVHFEYNMGWRKRNGRPKLVAKPDESGESLLSRIVKKLQEF